MDEGQFRWRALFDDRYGTGAYARLTELFQQPCVTFAEIARQFGVSREQVRQWHQRVLPGAPTGHQRQRLCALLHQKRRLLADPLFRAFYRHARPHVEAGRIELIRIRDGYRARSVRIDGRTVAIRAVRSQRPGEEAVAYLFSRYRGSADFVYYRVTDDEYFFLPGAAAPASDGTFSAAKLGSRYGMFKNSFNALRIEARRYTA